MSSRRSAQRRHADRHHREPVVQVLAELARGDLGFQVARGRGDDAHVDRDLAGAADALEGLIDQHAQDLVLRLARHVGDFVDEQRAAMRLLQGADLARPRCRCAVGAEQFDLHALRRDRGGIDDDEGPAARADNRWMVRAASSLPEPEGPTIRMRLLVGATRSIVWRSCDIAAEWPISVAGSGASCLSCLTSRLSREVSSARSATSTSRSALNGFSMKS